MSKYIDATENTGKEFYLNFIKKGKIVMLNLLKFKSIADYQDYKIYMENTMRELNEKNSHIIFYGKSKSFLIGPEFEKWDVILLVEHQSVETFMAFSKSKAYLDNLGHRTAALEDSRLLPSNEIRFSQYKLINYEHF